ncbi:AMP-binding protein [Frankia sp. Cppng1_Ct_nod]|uniref:AMP-binding protein n=1 Tax=Frankia sp. Cppng1_Ct_nod TaxID=2897162 RepID=UPI0010415E08|nr:AMP-binding protein [Frankia sp. Cppng1_Ct_nod]
MTASSVMTGAGQHTITVSAMLVDTVHAHPEQPAITYRRQPAAEKSSPRQRHDDWHTLTWHEFTHLVLGVVDGLDQVLAGARRVAVLAETDARYPALELALGLSGRAVQPLYVTSTDDDLRRAARTAGAEALVVGRSQRERARAAALHLPVVELDMLVPLPGVEGTPLATLAADVEPFDTALVRERLSALPTRPPGDTLLYLQSTGTTGPARVIEVSETAVLAAVLAVRGETTHPFPRFLSFLPTAHISERLLTLYVSLTLAGHTWYGGGLPTLESDLPACRPTVLLAPPLVYEAVRGQALASAASSALGRRLAASVQRTADEALSAGRTGGTGRRPGAWVFGRQLRRRAGLARVQDAFAGTAPVPADLRAWWEAVGVPVRNVYGQTEVAGATSITARSGAAFDGVGVPVRRVEVTIGDDNELLVRSPSLFTRYVGEDAVTARTLRDGWLHTGDRATIRGDGEIVLLGRVQSLVSAPDGTVVDTGVLVVQIGAELGPADIAVVPAGSEAGMLLYVAIHPAGTPEHTLREAARLDPVAGEDPRWARLAALVVRWDPHAVIRRLAMFDGAFAMSTGEVGPTGKPRGWRIHELRSSHLRERCSPAELEGQQSREHRRDVPA